MYHNFLVTIFILIRIKLLIIFLISFCFCQSKYNLNFIKNIKNEYNQFKGDPNRLSKTYNYNFTFNQYYYFNNNLPNLENLNGLYFPKGFGYISGLLFDYSKKYISLSFEPRFSRIHDYDIQISEKEKSFSVLNDVPLGNEYKLRNDDFRNVGIKLFYKGLSSGYGNWNTWWGPGIHSSLSLTNNAEGFYHYFISLNNFNSAKPYFYYKIKYTWSTAMKNSMNNDYYLSSWFLNLKYQNFEYGISRHILSGGYEEGNWSLRDASTVLLTNNKLEYWDQIFDMFFLYNSNKSGLKAFLEIGFPNRTSNITNKIIDHAMGSNIGLRKYGAFGIKELMFGIEYTRLVQGIYYNIMPTPNWYDNYKYNYSSYNGRRWAAHAGSDSDDLLLFMGYINNKISFVYGLNFERHGVTFHFPPEVKLESKISISYKINNIFLTLNYENEYYEHYGFVDNGQNIWDETFENDSIQRTQTLLLSIEHSLSF